MAAVIYLDSSDDEDESMRRELPRSSEIAPPQQLALPKQVVEVKEERDVVQTAPPSSQGEQRGGDVGASQSHDSSAVARRKGKMIADGRLDTQPQDDAFCRQFWQAGNYEDHPPKRRRTFQGPIDHVRVHPKFLHSNATSHKWALGAIAELLDNSMDEVARGATFCYVDKIISPRDGSTALLIQDDGGGMTPDAVRQCMSLGFSQKNSNTTIGRYGNGFKTSTMRLGADVIVFTRSASDNGLVTQTAGLLSYTFLRKTGHEDVVVPMVDYKILGSDSKPVPLLRSNIDDWLGNLATIRRWSPYCSEDELLKQFDDIGRHGTKAVIFNLWRDEDDALELDFDTDPHDIRLRPVSTEEEKQKKPKFQSLLVDDHISSQYRFSLRVYISILYLRMPENFRIILRGEFVEHYSVVDDLKFVQFLRYRPQFGNVNKYTHKDKQVMTTVGFTKEAPMVNIHGFCVYHKNRLIMPFWKVFHDNSSRGRGVVGVLEVDFIEPAHDKQDFERTPVFNKLEGRLKQVTMEYWSKHCHLIGYKPHGRKPVITPIDSAPIAVPSSLPEITAATVPIVDSLGLRVTSPTISLPDDPFVNDVQENQEREEENENPRTSENGESNHLASTSTSGPSTPDCMLGNKVAEGFNQRKGLDQGKVEVEAESRPSIGNKGPEERLTEIRQQNDSEQPIPLANREPGSMAISPGNSALLAEILQQNTMLREKCTEYEMREKHWELKMMVHEQLEKEHLLKISVLEKALMEQRMVGQMPNSVLDAAQVSHGPQFQGLQPLNAVKCELNGFQPE